MELQTFDPVSFLRDYWQQKPSLIRQPWAEWLSPLDGDDLAGLACEAGVESRLVIQRDGNWEVEHGPLDEDRFAELGDTNWSLLVQAVDHHVPEVAALIEPFRFIPNWRIDDVMVSYAADGGGVGPHFDQYDVFLIQGSGRRRWQIGGRCDETSPLLANDDLRLLAEFEPAEEFVLEPGDILYLPPGVAHDGVALGGDCMTISIGFRAPSRSELIEDWTEAVVDALTEDDRYADPGLTLQANPGEISGEALARLHGMVTEALADRAAFARWFGRFTSAPKDPEVDWSPAEALALDEVREALAHGAMLERNPASRFAYIAGAEGIELFVDGQAAACSGKAAEFAQVLCARAQFAADPVWATCEATAAIIAGLCNQGSLAFAEDD